MRTAISPRLATSTLLNIGRGSLAAVAGRESVRLLRAAAIIPAPTVSLLASSIRMKLPVRRLLLYGSNTSGVLVRRRTRPMSLSSSSPAAGVALERVHVEQVVDLVDDRAVRCGSSA